MVGGLLIMMLVLVDQSWAFSTSGPLNHPSSDELLEEPEPTGKLMFGDKCETTTDCGFKGSVCDEKQKSCQCKPELPATNHLDKCGVDVDINGTCFFNEQCENRVIQTECRDGRCSCKFELTPVIKNSQVVCIAIWEPPAPIKYVDPAMIGVLVGMALMFVIICVVLRLFSKARWRETRTIFNTPNPRLMNVSLLREKKPPGADRRGSKGSNSKVPSRQPSLVSLRPQSPAGASQGSRVSSRGSLRGSRSSSGSVKSPSVTTTTAHSQQTQEAGTQPNSVA